MVIEDVPLPGMPADPPAGTSPPAGVHLTRYSPRERTLCSDCIADIHHRGAAVAPPPRGVRWRFCVGALTLHLCEIHKNQRLEKL